MDFERTSVCRSSRSHPAWPLLASLPLLVGACTTAARAPESAETPDRALAEAVAEYREGIRLDPNSAAAHANLGSALFQEGEFDDALSEFREASRLEPTHAVVWVQIAQVYERKGLGAEALRALEAGLQANPDDAGILNQMSWLYATAEEPTLRDPEKALAYAQRAVEASGGRDANFLDTLAEAYYANRKFDEAIAAEERALQIAPGEAVFRIQLDKFRAAQATENGP